MGVIPGNSNPVPEGGNSPSVGGVGWMQNVTEQGVKDRAYNQVFPSMQGAKNSLFGNFIGGIFSGFLSIFQGGSGPSWLPSSVRDTAITIHDGQIALSDRIDLIPLGFCSAYMDRNINLAWGLNNLRKAPFRALNGPHQGAHVDQTNGHIVFDLPGTWTVHALMNCDGTSFTGDNNVTMYVSVRRPNGTIHQEKQVASSPNTNPDSLTLSNAFVIPEAGYYVAIWVWSGRWRWWRGGTDKSGLTVVRSMLGTDNQGDRTVPDETQNETKV
ncbi:hypothetical protein [Corynebacterium sp. CNJ-954]|uniref:hypothetical protein n=1 Tax=Corynebacterium sp. CNJ-954 TaxID=1904962 RepID=UPI001115229E|nr:hypothetical protein [Corynebacterium sp. CNJ-954]